MLNILGKVLGPVTPTAWKREQIAYAQRYNHGWETINAQFGTDTANPNFMGAPNTYQDYVLRNLEMSKKGGTGGLPYTVPSTVLSAPAKIAGGVMNGLSYVAAAETGFQIGKGVSRAFGMNVTGGLCDPGFADAGIIALVTGTDCSSMNAVSPEFKAALAANPSVTAGQVCTPDASWCVQLVAVASEQPRGGASTYTVYCGLETGRSTGVDSHWRLSVRYTTLGVATWGPVGEGAVMAPGTGGYFDGIGNYSCYRKGVPKGVYGANLAVSGGFVWIGAPVSGPVGATNDPFTYRLENPFTNVSTPVQTAVDGSSSPRTVQCTITGDDNLTYSASSPAYTDASGAVPAPVCPTLPPGVGPLHVSTQSVGAGGTRPISSQDTTAASRSLWTTYPECRDGQCKLDLKQTGAGTPSCFDLQATCNGWFADPAKDTKYQCTYGIHPVTLDECAVYSGVFDPARIASGAPYSDPMTGVWSGGSNAPSPDKQAMAQTVQNPDVMRTCNGLAASSSFDPVSFVMRPIQCALEWAFVPRDAVVKTSLLQVNGAWSTTPFGSVVPLLSQFSSIPVFTGCDGLPVDFVETWPVHWEVHWRFGAACTGPLATLAGTVRAVLGLGVAILGVLGFTRYFGASLGFIGFGRRGDHE